jgi:hypothetical protein
MTLELGSELAMLAGEAEEAEEEKKSRVEETADRIPQRDQVIKVRSRNHSTGYRNKQNSLTT